MAGMARVTLAEAASQGWDAVLAGSSFSAMFFARALPADWRILIIEKGPTIPHAEQLRTGYGPQQAFAQKNLSGQRKEWVAHTLFGGNSNCWWACTPRFLPSDFRLKTTYGVGADWQLSYDDLEEAYCDAEAVMEVTGGGSDHLMPRSRPFPYPPHPPMRSDIALRAASRDWFAQPSGRSNGGRRTVCCVNGVCGKCPVDAKFSILNSLAEFDRPGLFLLQPAELRSLSIAGRTAETALVRGAGGEEREIRAPLFALGTNPVNNVAILLRSGLSGPALGAGLHEQLSITLAVDIDAPNYFGGTSTTGHGYPFYEGDHRRDAGAVLIENRNAPAMIRPLKGRWTERLHLKLIAEDLPQDANRVALVGDAPEITWTGHHPYALAGLRRAEAALAAALPFRVEGVTGGQTLSASEAHIQGGHRMGADPATSVVDAGLRCHSVPNLLALGAGVFPSCSAANPTLTVAALALHAARRL